MINRYEEIEGKIYICIGDSDWLGTFQRFFRKGYHKGFTTKDRRGRYWLVMEKQDA